ncbi:MAG TPA: glycosyltransferase [Allosphingosinicella sp.]|jgi:glycosyltransferase involved in cell wall biosynthesis
MAKVLYLTQDGITDHIGQAQVAPYIMGLARRGHDIHVVSAEKPGREALKAKYEAMFAEAGIRWSWVRYANRPPLVSSFWTLWRMYALARRVARDERPDLIHCRAYLPLELALPLKREFGAKLLVDFRDFWADVGIEKKPFKFVYRHLKRREPSYLCAADHIVTLTDRAADILANWYPSAVGGDRGRYTVIPCCADFTHFEPGRVDRSAVEAHRRELDLGEGPILLYLGSIGHDYLLPEMLRLFRELFTLRPTARFLFVSNNAREVVERECQVAGIPSTAFRFVSVDRAEVPEYIALADLSVVFIRPTLSKAGCSPTKLAELFALNVPVIANAGVGDLDAIVDYGRNGSVIVPDFEPATLRAALEQVLTLPAGARGSIRAASAEFSLEEGIRRYASIYDRLVPPACAAAA